MKLWPRAKCCLKQEKQQPSGCRRASMIFAFGSIRWMSPTCAKLLGILSMKNGRAGLALDARLREVLLAERAQLVGGKLLERARIGGLPSARVVRLPTMRAIMVTSGSSCVPSTCEWVARICSMSVEPERGNPTTKIGSGAGQPTSGAPAKNSRVKSFFERATCASLSSAS